MQLEQRMATQDAETVVRVIDGSYEHIEDGYNPPQPVITLVCRTADDGRVTVEVDDFVPYFYVSAELGQATVSEINDDRRVRQVVPADRQGLDPEGINEYVDLLRVETIAPWHVKKLRVPLHDRGIRTWEADVRFIQRFLTDMGIGAFASISRPVEDLDGTCSRDEISGVGEDNEIEPRLFVYDIEVWTGPTDQGRIDSTSQEVDNSHDANVVTKTGTERAEQPITAVSAYDSYTETYHSWVLRNDDWDSNWDILSELDTEVDVSVQFYGDEGELVSDVIEAIGDADLLVGWNSNSFDTPYLVNRAFNLGTWSIKNLGPNESVNGDGSWINSDVTDVHCFDLLEGFKKTSYHELKSYSLGDVAAELLDIDKLDVDIDDVYRNDPSRFIEYSIRDVVATKRINDERGIC